VLQFCFLAWSLEMERLTNLTSCNSSPWIQIEYACWSLSSQLHMKIPHVSPNMFPNITSFCPIINVYIHIDYFPLGTSYINGPKLGLIVIYAWNLNIDNCGDFQKLTCMFLWWISGKTSLQKNFWAREASPNKLNISFNHNKSPIAYIKCFFHKWI
jgi:hypothetical protein